MGLLDLVGLTTLAASARLTEAAVSAALQEAAAESESERAGASRRKPVAGAGTIITAGALASLDSNTECQGAKWRGEPGEAGIVHKMMTDPHVRQSVQAITDPLRAADWVFVAASDDPVDREAADFCQWSYLERLPWDRYLERVVRGYVSNGFALEEQTDDLVTFPAGRFPYLQGDRALAPTGLHQVVASSVYRWHQAKDAPSQLDSIDQYIPGSDEERPEIRPVPAERLIRWTLEQDGAGFEGVAKLRSAYGAWKLKIAFQVIDAIKHERVGVGTPAITGSEQASDEDLDAAESILAEMRVNEKGYIVLPYGYTFQWVGATTSDGTNINEAIERCNKDIMINVSAGFTLLGLTGKTGSYALGATQQGQYHLSIESHARFFADVLNLGVDGWSPVERIVRANYGPDVGIPRLVARNLPTRNWADVIPVLAQAKGAGLITYDPRLENEIRAALQFSPLDEDYVDELDTKPEPEPEGGFELFTESLPDEDEPTPDQPDEQPVDDEQTEDQE